MAFRKSYWFYISVNNISQNHIWFYVPIDEINYLARNRIGRFRVNTEKLKHSENFFDHVF